MKAVVQLYQSVNLVEYFKEKQISFQSLRTILSRALLDLVPYRNLQKLWAATLNICSDLLLKQKHGTPKPTKAQQTLSHLTTALASAVDADTEEK